nr:response regulator [uncultured Dyadobacter sp.]
MVKRKTIFLVEDDEDDRLLFCDILLREVPDLQIIEFTDAGQLLALINGHGPWKEPDLILTDLNMPALNGLDLLGAVRQHERIDKVPVVMMSTASNDELVAQAYELGVNAFIAKPVSTADYAIMASAISICFLNGFWRSLPLPANGIRNDARLIIVEDSDEHWNLIKLSFQSNGSGF